MRDTLNIGSVPCDEDCVQLKSGEDYLPKMKAENRIFIRQLRRVMGEEPDGARLFVKTNAHDFGSYSEVECRFDTDSPESEDYAFKCESEMPAFWDDEALKELDAEGIPYDKNKDRSED